MSCPTKTRSVELQYCNGKPSGAVDNDGLHEITCRWRVMPNGYFVIRSHQRLSLTLCVGRKKKQGGLWMFGEKKDKIQQPRSMTQSENSTVRERAGREQRVKRPYQSIPDEQRLFKWMN